MVCQESIDGDISCELGDKSVEFSIEELSGNKAMQEDYMCGHFDESCVFSFAEGMDLEIIQRAVELAVEDYDRIVFGMSRLHKGDDLTTVQKFLPELKVAIEPSPMWQNYDKFDLDAFYKFCKENPIDHSTQPYMQSFLDLERTTEVEEFIVGIWIKNHITELDMKNLYNKKTKKWWIR